MSDKNKKAFLSFCREFSGELCNSACNGATDGLFLLRGAGLVNVYQFFCTAGYRAAAFSGASWRRDWFIVCPRGRGSFCAMSLDFTVL